MSADVEAYLDFQERKLRGDLVRQRILAGLSRKQVGRRMGIDSRDVEKIEEGKGDLHMSTLRRYCLSIEAVIDWQVLVPKGDERAVETYADIVDDTPTGEVGADSLTGGAS